MADVPAEEMTRECRRRFALWQLLKRLSWIALVGGLLWFILRELRPGMATIGDDAVMPMIAIAGLFLGAVLVGAKLALAPPGRRPAFNDMLALLVAPAFALLLGAWALNHVGGGPEQQFIGPVTGLIKEKSGTRFDFRVETLAPDGKRHEIVLASGVASNKQEKWDDFAGFRRGECARLTWRNGSLGQMIYSDSEPIACPPTHGVAPPDGMAMIAVMVLHDRVTHWSWQWPDAAQGAAFESWYKDLLVTARRHQAELSGRTIGLVARIEPDGRISAARVDSEGIDPAIAHGLASTLLDRREVLNRPDIPNSGAEPVWVRVPLSLTVE